MAREHLGLTQQQAARRWKLSQTYLSLMEGGKRRVPEPLARRLARTDPNLATALPPHLSTTAAKDLPALLGALGYPAFEYLARPGGVSNPAAVVLTALKGHDVPPRVTEALPWVLMTFPDLDWQWLVAEAKLANLQNRLGYVVSLASELTGLGNGVRSGAHLEAVRVQLEEARLVKEDTLGRNVTEVERQYFRQHRPEAATHWNLLTTLRAEDLRYGH
jgi:transcriptional regulator with XRE-family HTH domain